MLQSIERELQLVPGVAAEHLVAAIAGEDHSDVRRRDLGEPERRDRRGVPEWLVEVGGEAGQDG